MAKQLVFSGFCFILVVLIVSLSRASTVEELAEVDQEIKALEIIQAEYKEKKHDEIVICKLPPEENIDWCKDDTVFVTGIADEGTICSFTHDQYQDSNVRICRNGYWFVYSEKHEDVHNRIKKSHTVYYRSRRWGRRRTKSIRPNHRPSFYGKGRCRPSTTTFYTSSRSTSTYFVKPRAWDVEQGYITPKEIVRKYTRCTGRRWSRRCRTTYGHKRGDRLQGSTSGKGYIFTYIATDRWWSSASCSFYIYVKIRSCSKPSAPRHGSVLCPSGTRVGSTCYFSCYSGYRVSRSSAYCRSDGTWTYTSFYCTAITCSSSLPSVINGHYQCNGYTYGTTCYTSCNTGYRQHNSCPITCRSTGTWYRRCTSICKDSERPVLTNCPANIEKLADTGLTSSVVTWALPIATDNQDITNPVPQQTTGSIKNGDRVYKGTIHTIRYVAYDNARNPSNECKFTVKVTVSPCASLSAPLHGRYTCTNSYAYDSTCSYTCTTGYTNTDTMVTRCDAHGRWSLSTTPICGKTQCQPPNTIESLSFQYGSYQCPSVIEYKDVCKSFCDTGFKLSPSSTIECSVNSYNHPQYIQLGTPVCVDITPPVFETCQAGTINLTFTADKGNAYATVSYKLPTATDNVDTSPDVQRMSGPALGETLSAGVYSVVFKAFDTARNPSDICIYTLTVQTIECDVIPPPTGGDVLCDKDEIYGSICTLACHVGYELAGLSTTECLQDGSWSNTLMCNKKFCTGPPTPIDNSIFTCSDIDPVVPLYPYNTLCLLVCAVGFAADQDTYVRCDENKLWNGIDTAKCKDITRPTIHDCVSTLNFTADHRLRSTTITWAPPTSTDNADPSPKVTQLYGPKIGDTLEGSAIVKYQATDDSGNPSSVCIMTFHVHVLECEVALWPDNGAYTCDLSNIYGSICTYTCDIGHKFKTTPSLNSVDVNCLVDQTWSYGITSPTCIANVCGPPETRGHFGEFMCNDPEYKYPAKCTLVCQDGFATGVVNTADCAESGLWVYTGNEQCKDVTPPVIVNCKPYQTFYVDRASNTTSVNWIAPTATDNADIANEITIEQISGTLQIGAVLTAGEYNVGYRAIDTSGNPSTNNCSIALNIEELFCEAPSIRFTDEELLFVCQSYQYGHSCNIGCMNGKSLTTTSANNIVCEGNVTSTLPTMYWGTLNKHPPQCEDPNACPKTLNVPMNGALVYQPATGDPSLAIVTCNVDNDMPFGSTDQLLCLQTGNWHPTTVPDCSRRHHPGMIVLPVEYRYSGDCSSPETIEAIKSATLDRIYAFFAGIESADTAPACVADFSCSVHDLQVECGTSIGKKRSAIGNIRVRFFFKKIGDVKTFDDYLSFETDLLAVMVLFKNTWFSTGMLDMHGFILELDSLVEAAYAESVCVEPGTILEQGITCKSCGKGKYLSTMSSTRTCEECPLGTYSNNDTTTACAQCPDGQSTNTTRAKSSDMCLDKCKSGSISVTGVVPCTPCSIGTHQPSRGKTSCVTCASQLITFKYGASNCASYDLLLESGVYTIPLLQLDEALTTFSITFWARLNGDAVVSLTSSAGLANLATIALNGHTNGVATIILTEAYEDRWTRFSVIVSTDDISIYMDGQLAYYDDTVSATRFDAGLTLLLNTESSTDISFSGIGVFGSLINVSDATSSTHCMVNQTTALTTTDSILAIHIPGISVTPSSCKGFGVCIEQPCGAHTCNPTFTGYTCTCNKGYTGDNCEHEPNLCISHSCLNDATCVSQAMNYTCTCAPGYIGNFCEKTTVNGGWSSWTEYTTCTKTCDGGTQQRSRSCTSPAPGPHGATCDGSDVDVVVCNTETCLSINPCNSSPCGSHSCVDLTDGYECKCNSGYMGSHCEIVPDNCYKHQCRNDATCLSDDSGYTCACSVGLTGKFCQTVIDSRSYWTKWSSCSVTCGDGARTRTRMCVSTVNSVCVTDTQSVACGAGFCLEDSCTLSPCGTLNQCVNTGTSFTCICSAGYTGTTCEQPIDNCINNSCNYGYCTSHVDGFICNCNDGYSGELCDIAPVNGDWSFWIEWSDCSAVCGYGTRKKSRMCNNPAPGQTGKDCEGNSNQTETCNNNCGEYCAAVPCGKSHLCVSHDLGYTCHCNNSYTGVNCHIPPDHCKPNPCSNQGVCSVDIDDFQCACVGGYSGDTCDDEPEPSNYNPWADWSECSESCDGGLQQRMRTCANGTNGDPCDGNDVETATCEEDACPVCSQLTEKYGMTITCNVTGDTHVCHMDCIEGYSLTNGTVDFDVYTCGPNTSFEWDQVREIPSCNRATSPGTVTFSTTTTVEPEVACDEKSKYEDSLKESLSNTSCGTDPSCYIAVTVSGCTNRRKRETSETSSVEITFSLTNTNTNLTNEELQAEKGGMMNDSLSSLSDSAAMTIVVDGTVYTADTTAIDADIETICAFGYTEDGDDSCVACSPGTMFDELTNACKSCPQGFFQELSGQFACTQCPEGYTTETSSSWNSSDCSYTCAAGTYMNLELTDCVDCPIGYYQELDGQIMCLDCLEGYTTNEIASYSSSDCVVVLVSSDKTTPIGIIVGSIAGGLVIVMGIGFLVFYKTRSRKAVYNQGGVNSTGTEVSNYAHTMPACSGYDCNSKWDDKRPMSARSVSFPLSSESSIPEKRGEQLH